MGNEQLVTMKLIDLCELIIDCPHSTPKWTDSGYIVLRNQNIRNGSLDLSSPSFTDENGYKSRIKRAEPKAGDLVLTREAPMGEVCLIPKGLKCCLGQRQVLLRPKTEVSGEYLFWALQSPFVQHQVSWNEGTGTTVSNIRIPVLKAFEIPRWFQHESMIASHLSAIRNKIDLNRQINQTLEQMAKTLFKSWFVDFDPVIDNALDAGFFEQDLAFSDELLRRVEIRKAVRERDDFKELPDDIRQLFPDSFEECAEPALGLGGWIPTSWTLSNVGAEFDVTMGQSPPSSTYNEIGIGLPFFQGKTDFGFRFPTNRVYCTAPKRMANKNDTLISVRAPVGDINLAAEDCAIGRGIAAARHKSGCISFTYYSMNSLSKYFEVFEGEGTVFGSINQKDFKALLFIKYPFELINKFDFFCSEWDKRIDVQSIENIVLTKLRDTLLPKLISGELSLSDIKIDNPEETLI
ncbi:restriction endonuclease subunit S [Providencia sp. Me31A]|uniref:restriction endonuclease subunit S n=1 Tax=Providencia sp. Me31A TaxID=3392637 RepID=UPI003D284593